MANGLNGNITACASPASTAIIIVLTMPLNMVIGRKIKDSTIINVECGMCNVELVALRASNNE
jgi:hypothetical protein